ncbi:hypothetical protein ACFPES_26620 [Paenibacillus sp. GCM10023248]|uniref:hypothetical protein n=1 Tax=Bacillus sp. 3255 TaxID=2817904 RepID=UPI00286BA1DF|nr:hypothetical protein [Bacillus sp. 3255]MDD9270635.1 hypothetical protein [Paenibacillus sp. MAHUQ-63]
MPFPNKKALVTNFFVTRAPSAYMKGGSSRTNSFKALSFRQTGGLLRMKLVGELLGDSTVHARL